MVILGLANMQEAIMGNSCNGSRTIDITSVTFGKTFSELWYNLFYVHSWLKRMSYDTEL